MRSENSKAAFALLGAVSSVLAAASIVLFKFIEAPVHYKGEIASIAIGVAAVALAAISAFYMQQQIKRQHQALRRVFIMYAREDLPQAREIASLLKENGLNPWLDVEEIEGGQLWKDEIEKALDDSAMAVVLTSKNFANSSLAMHELNRALNQMESSDKATSPIIPVKIDSTALPNSLSHIQYVDMSDSNATDFLIKSLKGAMRRVAGSAGSQTREAQSELR
jgi:hypothetical protein